MENQPFIPLDVWDKNRHQLSKEDVVSKFQQFGGCIGVYSRVSGISAVVAVSNPDADDIRYIYPVLLCPENISGYGDETDALINGWIDWGIIELIPSAHYDPDYVLNYAGSLSKTLNVAKIIVDCYQYDEPGKESVSKAIGKEIEYANSTIHILSYPTKFFESMVYKKCILHDGNPVLRNAMDMAVILADNNGNVRLRRVSAYGADSILHALIFAFVGVLDPSINLNSVTEINAGKMENAIEMIAAERKRQIEELGYDVANDELYKNNELARAAVAYALRPNLVVVNYDNEGVPIVWPWDGKYWKPTPDNRIRELVKAAALLVAQIDRELHDLNNLSVIDPEQVV